METPAILKSQAATLFPADPAQAARKHFGKLLQNYSIVPMKELTLMQRIFFKRSASNQLVPWPIWQDSTNHGKV